MVKLSHLMPLNCFSFTDRRRTPRTTWQRLRKSWRKSARSLKSLEENCPTECCSAMWGSRVKFTFFSNLQIYYGCVLSQKNGPRRKEAVRKGHQLRRVIYIIYLWCSWSLRDGSLMAPQLWQSSTLQIHQREVGWILTALRWFAH